MMIVVLSILLSCPLGQLMMSFRKPCRLLLFSCPTCCKLELYMPYLWQKAHCDKYLNQHFQDWSLKTVVSRWVLKVRWEKDLIFQQLFLGLDIFVFSSIKAEEILQSCALQGLVTGYAKMQNGVFQVKPVLMIYFKLSLN